MRAPVCRAMALLIGGGASPPTVFYQGNVDSRPLCQLANEQKILKKLMLKKSLFFKRSTAALVRHPKAIVVGCAGFALIMLALVSIMLIQERQDAVLRAVESAENLALVVDRDASRTADLFDLSLQAVVDGVQDPDVMRLPPQYRQQILFDRSITAGQHMGVLLYVDQRGEIAIDSQDVVPRKGNFADRGWFTHQRDNPNAGLYISPPYQSRLRQQEWSIAFSRRVNHPDGSFAGVVVGALELTYFKNLLAGLKFGPHAAITLFHDDGTIVTRTPERPGQIGRNLGGTLNFERFKLGRDPWFFGKSVLDTVQRLYVYRKFEKIPLLISVAPAASDVYQAWNRRAWRIGIFAIFLASALLAAAWLLAAEFKYRMKIENDLSLLARTDGLTGLNNRRTLDDALELEWRRTKRAGTALSLIFVDIDRFKNFNDSYGHQTGDDALTAVANAISATIQRPGDIAARFGGEEFVVVLPDTTIEGAAAVAAKIHKVVRALQIEHRSSEHAIVTVSIGAACSAADDEADVLALLKAADEAVYEAKSGGRNRTALAMQDAGFTHRDT